MDDYWKVDPHQWGPGQTHIIHEDGNKTLCGKRLSESPGRRVPAIEYDCRACARVLESQENRKQREQEWKEKNSEYAAQQAAKDREWWKWYNAYLQSPEWRARRAAVLKRAGGRCESCQRWRATQVHHTTYAHVGDEPLFELRAICYDCHEKLTAMDRQQRRTA